MGREAIALQSEAAGVLGGLQAGELRFMDAPGMGSSYRGVHADDTASLNLLQQRLNELGENVEIQIVRGC